MPNVYILLGVHGFFRDAPTTLYVDNIFSLDGRENVNFFVQNRPIWFEYFHNFSTFAVGNKTGLGSVTRVHLLVGFLIY